MRATAAFFAFAISLTLVGCANPEIREISAWSAAEKARVQRGELKWSVYYTDLFNKLDAASPFAGRVDAMEWTARLIAAAALYESGQLSRIDFETLQRQAVVAAERQDEASSAARARAAGDALRNYGNAVFGPDATRARQIPLTPTISCRTVGATTVCD